MTNYDQFIQGILHKQKLRITYFSKKDNAYRTRLCAPLDFGPKRKQKSQDEYIDDGKDQFLFFDLESSSSYIIAKNSEQVSAVQLTEEKFDPREVFQLSRQTFPFCVARDW